MVASESKGLCSSFNAFCFYHLSVRKGKPLVIYFQIYGPKEKKMKE